MKRFGSRLTNQMAITLYLVWGIITILWAITAFQVQAALLSLGILLVNTPSLLPPGWNTHTLHGLNKFLIFIVAAVWLGLVMYSQDYLREALEEQRFSATLKRLLLITGAVYLISGGLIYLSSLLM